MTHFDQHSPLMSKFHCDRDGVHCAYKMITQPNNISADAVAEHQRKIRCAGLGFMSFVKRATTASLGKANDRIPGQKAAMVYLITFCCCSTSNELMCRPLPDATAALEMPRLTNAQICSQRQHGTIKFGLNVSLTIATTMK